MWYSCLITRQGNNLRALHVWIFFPWKSNTESVCVWCTTCVIYTPTFSQQRTWHPGPRQILGVCFNKPQSNSRAGSSASSSEQGFAHHSCLCYHQDRGLSAKGQVKGWALSPDIPNTNRSYNNCILPLPSPVTPSHTALATLSVGACTALTSHTLFTCW